MALSDNNSGWYAGKIIKRLLNKAQASQVVVFPALTLPTGSPGGPMLEGQSTTFAEQAAAEAERPQSSRLGDHDLDP